MMEHGGRQEGMIIFSPHFDIIYYVHICSDKDPWNKLESKEATKLENMAAAVFLRAMEAAKNDCLVHTLSFIICFKKKKTELLKLIKRSLSCK